MEGITIKVKPQDLKNISTEVITKIDKTECAFREIENIIDRSNSYWTGVTITRG